ncbi:MAG: hypothetical protein ABSD72_10295 [Terracidiphilus sp.]|jgi:hypothetical protein
MNKLSPFLLGLSLAAAGGSLAAAQDQTPPAVSAPKYLQIIVEYTKPGKGGAAHDKTESAFVQAATKVNFPIHYLAFNAMSGKPRAIFISHFDSFEAVQTANKVFETNGEEFDRINEADGELLESTNQLFFKYVPEMSYHPHGPNPHGRYLEARIVHVRPGHGKEFEELVKVWIAANDKVGSNNHWGAYRIEYGEQIGSYVFLSLDDSMADIDKGEAESPKFMEVMSEADRRDARELRSEAIDADRFELYSVNPAQSYPPEEFVKADPDFWAPKAAAKPEATGKKPKHE